MHFKIFFVRPPLFHQTVDRGLGVSKKLCVFAKRRFGAGSRTMRKSRSVSGGAHAAISSRTDRSAATVPASAAEQGTNAANESLVNVLPALERIITQATANNLTSEKASPTVFRSAMSSYQQEAAGG